MIVARLKIHKWLPHIIGVLFFAILPLFVFDNDDNRATFWIYTYYYQLAFMLVAFYVNFLIIVPKYFFAKNRLAYFITVIVFTIALLYVSQYLYELIDIDSFRNEIVPDDGIKQRPEGVWGLHPKIIDNFFLILLVLGFSTGMAIIQRLVKNETLQKAVEKARVDSELAFLKNQISPHFFFNSLNNIYALIAIDTDKAQDAVEKLSGLMRYLIYESDIKTVELQKEFEFTQNYIDLMQQRLTSKVKLNINIQQKPPKVEIPPLIFIPFIENAFKHGISYREDSFISVDLKTENHKLVFDCKNSIPQQAKDPRESGGVGIVNIKKRLELIYGDHAQLTMNNDGFEHSVHLIIPLK
jgi:sensor histidine kinase YesM